MRRFYNIFCTLRPLNMLIGAAYAYMSCHYIQEKEWAIYFPLSTFLSIAAGNIWNDLHDKESDKINKPQQKKIYHFIGEKQAYTLIYILMFSSLLSGILTKNIYLFLVVTGANFALWAYGKWGKKWGYLGNYVVASLSALCIGAPAILSSNADQYSMEILYLGAFLAFAFSFMREWVKDIEDIEGDLKSGARTGVIRGGLGYAFRLLRVYSILLAALLLYIPLLYQKSYLFVWILLFIPVLYWVNSAARKEHIKKVSFVLKLLFLSGFLVYTL